MSPHRPDAMNRRRFIKACAACALASAVTPALLCVSEKDALGLRAERGYVAPVPSPWFEPLADGAVRCTLCPRGCAIESGGRGFCEVRENRDGTLFSLTHANPCAVNVDPVEKKPFFHVLPGTRSFSIATAGCNFDCKFCQNWEISQARPEETWNVALPPEEAARAAAHLGCASVACTYVEPTIFAEYMLDVGRAVRDTPILATMHSNGYVNPAPLDALCEVLDAACIDLKGFSEAYYAEMTGGTLAPVLQTLKTLRARGVHLELVNLLVPGKNDAPDEVRALCEWVHGELGPDTPVHFTRFYPHYKLTGLPPTPVAALEAARDTAMRAGLHFAYVGNVPGHEGEHTFCPQCGARLIERLGFQTRIRDFAGGACTRCGRQIPGIWG